MNPQVLDGRNPWWRAAWEKLTPTQRMAVRDAMSLGLRVSDDALLPFVYGLMAIERRTLRWVWPGFIWVEAISAWWIYVMCFRRAAPGWECWMFLAIALAGLIALPVRIAIGRRRLRRVEEANLWGSPQSPGKAGP